MFISLGVKNKIGFIDGSILQPLDDDHQYMIWIRNANVVAYWLLNVITKELIVCIMYSSAVAIIWNDLQELFQNNGPFYFSSANISSHALNELF